ncbi:SGNH/GDSL hydrolase family protein, partial [Mycoplasma marinum]
MPIITVVSCGHKKDETIIRKPKYSNNQKVDLASLIREKNQKFIYENDDDSNPILDYKKIKIVSLGDSVSAGYSQLDEKDHRGYSNNGKISGISYGSYIARALNKNNKLSEFNNFGIGGATTDTLRSQLDPKYKLNGNSETRSNLINAKLVFPEKGEKERFTKIQEKLREADFVTISIGANDILYSLKIGGLTINEILAKGTDKINMSGGINSLITYDKKEFNAAVKKAQNNLMAIISRIKSFNSKVKIVIVGYPMPITQLSSIIKIVRDSDGCSLAEKLLKTLDGIGGRIANQFNTVDFIDGYIENTWDKNSITLAPELLDIHPGARGYKMIAATILSRLTGITNTKIDERNAFLPTDSKVRLKGFYGDSIKEYTDINFPLTKEEEKVDGLAKPYKLFRFATNLIAKIVRTNNASNSLTTDLIKNYGNTSMADNAKYLFP